MSNKKNTIFGIRTVSEAIKSGKQIDKVFIKKELKGELIKELLELLKQFNIPVQYLPIEGLNKITTKNHQGVIALCSIIEYQNIEYIIPGIFEQGLSPLILILDGITDVRNLGAICRTAECAGVHAIVIPATNSAQINADTVKASSGAIYYLPICRTNNMYKTIKFLKNSGLKIFSATEKADEFYYHFDYSDPSAIVLGSEYKGVSRDIIKLSDHLIKIPV
ncbi:MAG: 23S rRNA (guanosine(2251)-2'-O)-methyltransferase RlmB, partial [Bacteroidales bacterium]|nr:23S rRNA (guanosine(2251)-2'-O)-methyltransferase RlmB [Bacteroidales bacterium]